MIRLQYSDIPSYLHNSGFYRSLDAEDGQGTIEIPDQAFKQDDTVTCTADLHLLLRTMHFWMLERIPEPAIQYCFNNAVQVWGVSDVEPGNDVLTDMKNIFRPKDANQDDIVCRAIEAGRVEIVNFLIQSNMHEEVDSKAATCAAKWGNLQILTLLHEHALSWDCTTTDAAALHGHLDCLQYAHKHGCALDTSALTAAATGGHLPCLQFIISTGVAWHRDVCTTAAEQGHLHILTYAYNCDCPWDDLVVEKSAGNGHLHCLRFALEQGCDVCEEAVYKASYGHLDCLSLLYDCEAPFDDIAAAVAAQHGSLQCVMFLIERGFGLTARTTCTAASCGQVHVLRYLFDNGVPYISTLLPFAANALQNRLECLQYLIEEQGLPINENGSLFGIAFMRADIACVQYLISIGCPYIKFKFRDFSSGDIVDVLQFDCDMLQCIECALSHGWQCDIALYKGVCKYNLLRCKQYLEREGHGVEVEEEEEVDLCGLSLFD